MQGEWQKKSNQRNEVITRGGGFDYYLEPHDGFKFNGNTSVQYRTLLGNTLINTQNYIPDGDNYSRRWNDSKNSGLELNSSHHAEFKTGNVKHDADGSLSYSTSRSRSSSTEGTFSTLPGDWASMRADLQADRMPDTLGILNRYLSLFGSDGKTLTGHLSDNLHFNLPHGHLFFASVSGALSHNWGDGHQQYLLQYAAKGPENTRRTHPQNAHGYTYGFDLGPIINLGTFWLRPEYQLGASYSYTSTMYYDLLADSAANAVADPLQQWQRLERARQVLDPGNSYCYGLHSLEQQLSCLISYEKSVSGPDGWTTDRTQAWIRPMIQHKRRRMQYRGFNSQDLDGDTWLPSVDCKFEWMKKDIGYLQLYYGFSTQEPQMFDMLDISLNSDPLNPTLGNPGLRNSHRHTTSISFGPNGMWHNTFSLGFRASYNWNQNQVVYGTSYDRATGIRTTRPENVNGNRSGQVSLWGNLKPLRDKRFSFNFTSSFEPNRFVTLLSTDGETGLQRAVSHSTRWWEYGRLEFRSNTITATVLGMYENRHNTSLTGDFSNYTTQYLCYGGDLLVRLPLSFEVSTSLRVEKRYGYTSENMNRRQVVWNARITKSILHGTLQLGVEGFDMLRQIKHTQVDYTSAYRRETSYNSLPSYFLFSIKYYFAKKPRK